MLRRGGARHRDAAALVRLVVSSPSWALADEWGMRGADGAALLEYRHAAFGRAWLATTDEARDRYLHCAWLEPGADVEAIAHDAWAARGGRLRLDVVNGNAPDAEARLSAAGGLGGRLYGAGAARLAELLGEQAAADRRGEGGVYLLSGPPGTGKSTLAARLAEASGRSLLVVGGSVLGQSDLGLLAWTERALRPGVTVLDDVDRALPRDLGPLLGWLQGRRERPGAVVLTANGPLPAALTREGRVDHVVPVSLPTVDERRVTLRALLAEHGVLEPEGLSAIVEATEGRGEAALVDAVLRLRDRPVEMVVEQIKRRRAVEGGAS